MRLGRMLFVGITAALFIYASPAAQQDADRKVAGGGVTAKGWQGKADAGNKQGLTVADSKFANEGSGFRVTTGPAAIYWNPANAAQGGLHGQGDLQGTQADVQPPASVWRVHWRQSARHRHAEHAVLRGLSERQLHRAPVCRRKGQQHRPKNAECRSRRRRPDRMRKSPRRSDGWSRAIGSSASSTAPRSGDPRPPRSRASRVTGSPESASATTPTRSSPALL